ncbi:MAG: enoyl-CoA hydratase-related protein [Acidimicrobiia bacterium]|nr:enoyl-CoA hydratase-related protein [Acidimicrobiia bacterium]
MGEFVRLEESSVDGVAVVRLDRPKVNALDKQMSQEILDVSNELAERSDLRSVVLWGGPRMFAAGADISQFPRGEGRRDPSDMVDVMNAGFLAFEKLPQITIAAVTGFALGGGCELAMCADFRICGESAAFGQPEILLGLTPGAGGTQRLPRLVGMTVAKELNYTGRMVPAAEAIEIGLVSAVHPDDEVFDKALEMAAGYAKGPAALANVKRAMQNGAGLTIEAALQVEKKEFVGSFQTDDAVIGITSFLESGPGKAEFTGR